MDQFIWKENFNIGVDEADFQHQTLLKCLNECIEKAPLTDEDFDIHGLLDELKTYMDTHFKFEEELMRSVNYPELELQRKQHRLLTAQVEQMEREVNSGKRHVIVNLAALLKDWFMQHILEDDKRIGAYLISRIQEQTH